MWRERERRERIFIETSFFIYCPFLHLARKMEALQLQEAKPLPGAVVLLGTEQERYFSRRNSFQTNNDGTAHHPPPPLCYHHNYQQQRTSRPSVQPKILKKSALRAPFLIGSCVFGPVLVLPRPPANKPCKRVASSSFLCHALPPSLIVGGW